MSERPPGANATDRTGSRYGDANHATEATPDERELYGEPCHEVGTSEDAEMLYGEPQHETRGESSVSDVDLLFARMQAEPFTGPTVLTSRTPSAEATEL